MSTEYVQTIMVPLADLTPYPGNARHGDRARLVESLEENGQYRSLVVREMTDGSLVVLAGNNTLAALEHRGDEAARCEILRCDDATALRVNLVDNASNDRATYDETARAALIAALDGAVAGSGYTEDEADAILARYEEPEIVSVPEASAEYNDDETERRARMDSHGGPDSKTYESRGVRDIFLAMPNAEADELGRIIMKLRESWGALGQADIILRACRVAQRVQSQYGLSEEGAALEVADTVFEAEDSDA